MTSSAAQRLTVWPGEFVIEHRPGDLNPSAELAAGWLCLVRAPEGLTVVREASDADPDGERWTAVYGDNAHALDLPGMLAAVIGPLAAAKIPVFVASTFHADVVLAPRHRRQEALSVLREAGHNVEPSGLQAERAALDENEQAEGDQH
jgi:uncharacterized protein